MDTDNSNLTPKKRRHARTRDTILQAAREIIVQQGLDAFSIRSLAERVDYSPSAIYKYFNDKEELLEELRKEGWGLLEQAAVRRYQEGQSPIERWVASGTAWLDFVDAYPQHFRLMMTPAEKDLEDMDRWLQNSQFSGLVNHIQEDIDAGVLKPAPGSGAREIALLLFANIYGFCFLKLSFFKKHPEEYNKIAQEAMRAFVHYIGKE